MVRYFLPLTFLKPNRIPEILKAKAAAGVEIQVIYDAIGCMITLSGNYDEILRGFGIDAVRFSKLKGKVFAPLM